VSALVVAQSARSTSDEGRTTKKTHDDESFACQRRWPVLAVLAAGGGGREEEDFQRPSWLVLRDVLDIIDSQGVVTCACSESAEYLLW